MTASLKKPSLPQESNLLLALISVRREDLLTLSLRFLTFKDTEAGDICLHTMTALCRSHFQVILTAVFSKVCLV